MGDQPQLSPGLADMDAMIARAEAACERGRNRLEAHRVRPNVMQVARQQAIEDTLARLRNQRASMTIRR